MITKFAEIKFPENDPKLHIMILKINETKKDL